MVKAGIQLDLADYINGEFIECWPLEHAIALDLPTAAEDIYLSLVAGRTRQTLDDGEAATLALSLHLGATALIDERKAIGVAKARFPAMTVATTADLLLSAHVCSESDADTLAEMLFASLTQARMRVPEHLLAEVCKRLGPERARLCQSLPARVRFKESLVGAEVFKQRSGGQE